MIFERVRSESSDAALRQLRDANYRELALLSIRELREEIVQYCESVGQPLSLVRKAWTDIPAELPDRAIRCQ